MPTSFEVYPAKQKTSDGHASVTLVNQTSHPQAFTTRTLLLSKGCGGSPLSGVTVPATIRLTAHETKTVHFTVGTARGDIGVIWTPATNAGGFQQEGSIGTQVMTTASAHSCVVHKPVADPPAGSSLSASGIGLLAVLALVVAGCFALAAREWRRRRYT